MPDDAKKGSLLAQIASAVVIALLVGGTSPWWFNALTGKGKPEPAPVVNPGPVVQPIPGQVQPLPSPVALPTQVAPDAALTASRDFFIGRWRVEQANPDQSGANNIDYLADGKMQGTEMVVQGTQGMRIRINGTWSFEKVSSKLFHITFNFDNGNSETDTFKILDRNHIQNVDQNYVAERVE